MPEWWNWHTQDTQNVPPVRAWGFESLLGYNMETICTNPNIGFKQWSCPICNLIAKKEKSLDTICKNMKEKFSKEKEYKIIVANVNNAQVVEWYTQQS